MNHTIEFEIENREYIEGECFNYKIKIKPTDEDDFIIQRYISTSDLSYMQCNNAFIENHTINLACVIFKDGVCYCTKIALIEKDDVLAIANVGNINEELVSNPELKKILQDATRYKKLQKEEEERILRKSKIGMPSDVYTEDAIYASDWSHDLKNIWTTGSSALGSSTTSISNQSINATATVHISPSQYSGLLKSLSSNVTVGSGLITTGNVGTLNGTSIIVDRYDPPVFLPSQDAYELMITKALSLFNNSERAQIFQGALKSNKLFRAIIQMAEKLKLPNWCGETL